MKLGYIGLGKMGKSMVHNLADHGHEVVVYNRTVAVYPEVERAGVQTTASLQELVDCLPAPRTVWIMVSWRAVDAVLAELEPLLAAGDTVIDGGNSPFADSVSRAERLATNGIHFLDIGVSGGPDGARNGACMMAGGDREVFTRHEDLLRDLCVPDGYGHFGRAGAGHFVKMVHNGIEYGMMQAIAEGFDIMRHNGQFDLDVEKIAAVYNRGSVIESRLMGWLNQGFERYGTDLANVSGAASATGEGEWTAQFAESAGISVNSIRDAVAARQRSQAQPSYQGKIVSVLRGMFGKHDVTPPK